MGMIHDWKNFKRQLEEHRQAINHQIEMVDWVIELYDKALESEQKRVQMIEFMRERVTKTSRFDLDNVKPPKAFNPYPPAPVERPKPDNRKFFKDGTEAIKQLYGYEGDKVCPKCGVNLRAKGDNHVCAPHVTGGRYECQDCGTTAPRGGFHSCDPRYKEWKCPKCGELATNKDIHFCGVGDNDPGNNPTIERVEFNQLRPEEKKLKCPACSTYFGAGQMHLCETGKIFIDKDTDPLCPFCGANLVGIKLHMCEKGGEFMSDVARGMFGEGMIDKEANEKNFEILDPEDWQGMT